MKKNLYVSFIFLSLTFFSFSQTKKVTVVLDPGHGGKDTGHLSENKNHLAEKELNLLIANKVGEYVQQYLTNVNIVYTRTTDETVSLDDRVFKANNIKADCFISIHCNDGNGRNHVHGTESHVNTMDSKKSVDLAQIMEKEFSSKAGRHSRGVKDSEDREHTLQVLKYTNMTSVLLECGFLTNEKEANYLNTTSGQEILASAIFRGIRTFLQKEYPTTNFVKTIPTKTTISPIASTKPALKSTFAIQIMSTKEPVETDHHSFKKIGEPVIRQKLSTTSEFKYRYIVGSFTTKEAGKAILEKVQQNGFKDAIIIQTE
jgi:N-acetylmuramoyl-L-alanine amidase